MFAATTRIAVSGVRPISMRPTEGTCGFFCCGDGISNSGGNYVQALHEPKKRNRFLFRISTFRKKSNAGIKRGIAARMGPDTFPAGSMCLPPLARGAHRRLNSACQSGRRMIGSAAASAFTRIREASQNSRTALRLSAGRDESHCSRRCALSNRTYRFASGPDSIFCIRLLIPSRIFSKYPAWPFRVSN